MPLQLSPVDEHENVEVALHLSRKWHPTECNKDWCGATPLEPQSTLLEIVTHIDTDLILNGRLNEAPV